MEEAEVTDDGKNSALVQAQRALKAQTEMITFLQEKLESLHTLNARSQQDLSTKGLIGQALSNAAIANLKVRTSKAAEASAVAMADLVSRLCPANPPIFDVMLLGLGDDGHTASLFPGTDAPGVTDHWATVGRGKGLDRITLTAPVLSAARQVIFLVSGANKQEALRRLMDPTESSERTPARLVQPASDVLIIADQDATAGL